MKKYLHLIIAMSAGVASAWAQSDTYAGSMLFGYCSNIQGATSGSTGKPISVAMQITDNTLLAYRGCKITAIAVANGSSINKSGVTELPIELFTKTDLEGNPTASYTGTMDLGDDASSMTYKEYPLPQPIEITSATKSFWVGYTVTCDADKYMPLVMDYATTTSDTGVAGCIISEDGLSWSDISSVVGFACMRIKIEGDALPADEAKITQYTIPVSANPSGTMTAEMVVSNNAGNPLSSLGIDYSVDGGEITHTDITLKRELLCNEYSIVSFDITAPAIEKDNVPVKFEITTVNGGRPNNVGPRYSKGSGTTLIIDPAKAYRPNVLAEIRTGTWCGFCPRAINAYNTMAGKYTDGSFIPVAAHDKDRMYCDDYINVFSTFGLTSAPQGIVNRDTNTFGILDYVTDRTTGMTDLERAYLYARELPAAGRISIDECTLTDSGMLDITSTSEFAVSGSGCDYAVYYLLTEDNVGPYVQQNYYSPASDSYPGATLEGWSDLDPEVETIYSAVARKNNSWRGEPGSLPADITAGTPYVFKGQVQMANIYDIKNVNVIAAIINRTTNRVVNSVSVPYTELASIQSVETSADAQGPAEYYDLTGRRVAAPVSGHIYIVRQGDSARTIRY